MGHKKAVILEVIKAKVELAGSHQTKCEPWGQKERISAGKVQHGCRCFVINSRISRRISSIKLSTSYTIRPLISANFLLSSWTEKLWYREREYMDSKNFSTCKSNCLDVVFGKCMYAVHWPCIEESFPLVKNNDSNFVFFEGCNCFR